MDPNVLERLKKDEALGAQALSMLESASGSSLVSVHWDLKTLMYAGVTFLSSGLGILVYKNIARIGHGIVLAAIAGISLAGYLYCWSRKLPFSRNKVPSPDLFLDYFLLLSSLLFVVFIGYWQYQYHVFGERLDIAGLIPLVFLFFTAYYFDHLGILCLAITNLAAWAGIIVSPANFWIDNDFSSTTLIYTAILLGLLLLVAGKAGIRRNFKSHFGATYELFGMNMLCISGLAALIHFDHLIFLWILFWGAICFYFYREARRKRAFYLVVLPGLYAYLAQAILIFRFGPFSTSHFIGVWIYLFLITTAVGLIWFLMKMNKKMNTP